MPARRAIILSLSVFGIYVGRAFLFFRFKQRYLKNDSNFLLWIKLTPRQTIFQRI